MFLLYLNFKALNRFGHIAVGIISDSHYYLFQPERFSPLDEVLEDSVFPHTRKLCKCNGLSSLDFLADVKGTVTRFSV